MWVGLYNFSQYHAIYNITVHLSIVNILEKNSKTLLQVFPNALEQCRDINLRVYSVYIMSSTIALPLTF